MPRPRTPARTRSATCHPDRYATSRGLCETCYRRALRSGEELPAKTGKLPPPPATCHPDRPSRAHGLCAPCYLAAWHVANPGYQRNHNLDKHHGKGARHDYNRLYAEQEGHCALCGLEERGTVTHHLSLDHDHLTGRRRRLLCNACNRGIGLLGDNPEVLRRAADYVEEFRT